MNAPYDYDPQQSIVFLDQRSGLLDMAVGLVMLCFGASILVDMGWLPAVLIAALTPVWMSINQKLASRAGTLPPEQELTSRRRLVLVAGFLLASLLLGSGFFLAFTMGGSLTALLRANFDTVIAVLTACLLAGLGLIFRAARYYAFALLALGLLLVGARLEILFAIPLSIVGGLVAITGAVLFIRWLGAHPAGVQ